MDNLTIVLIAIVVLAVAFAVFMYVQKERTRRLRSHFGSEYDRVVHDSGNSRKAEAELLNREKRIEKLHLRDLSRDEVDRFSNGWRAVQSKFVDAPRQAVGEADRLVRDVMSSRGYPMGNFEQRAADISVDHPNVIRNYRAAHEIAVRDAAGNANTEDLRQAMVHYRSLFEDLLGTTTVKRTEEVTR